LITSSKVVIREPRRTLPLRIRSLRRLHLSTQAEHSVQSRAAWVLVLVLLVPEQEQLEVQRQEQLPEHLHLRYPQDLLSWLACQGQVQQLRQQ
jgi:hypothetical protein